MPPITILKHSPIQSNREIRATCDGALLCIILFMKTTYKMAMIGAVIRLIFEMISLNLRPNKAFILVTDKLILGSFQLRLKRHLQGSARTSESSQVAQKASTD